MYSAEFELFISEKIFQEIYSFSRAVVMRRLTTFFSFSDFYRLRSRTSRIISIPSSL